MKRALERDLEHRYKSARDFARDLERFLKSSGDAVPAMDVAEWMTRVFPEGPGRVQSLLELAARVSVATAEDTVVRVPSVPPTAAPATTKLQPIPGNPQAVSVAAAIEPVVEPASRLVRRPRWMAPALILVASLAVGIAFRALQPASTAIAAPARTPSNGASPSGVSQPLTTAPVVVTADSSEPVVAIDSLPVLPDEPSAARRAGPNIVGKTATGVAHESAAPSPSDVVSAGLLYVTSPGGGGDALIDGRVSGRIPGRFQLAPGSHDLLIRGDSGVQKHVTVEITGGSPALLTVDLTQ